MDNTWEQIDISDIPEPSMQRTGKWASLKANLDSGKAAFLPLPENTTSSDFVKRFNGIRKFFHLKNKVLHTRTGTRNDIVGLFMWVDKKDGK